MLRPTAHQGSRWPPRKNVSVLRSRRAQYTPMPSMARRYAPSVKLLTQPSWVRTRSGCPASTRAVRTPGRTSPVGTTYRPCQATAAVVTGGHTPAFGSIWGFGPGDLGSAPAEAQVFEIV
jgi:hypothetical protein